MRITHLSDLHFGHHDEQVAASLAADIATQEPDLVVISGDFTQMGTPSEFAAARAFLDQLQTPFFAVPETTTSLRSTWSGAFSIPMASIGNSLIPISSRSQRLMGWPSPG
jgi:hypothetical protein